jgi:heat-inducible transcriptional repressor
MGSVRIMHVSLSAVGVGRILVVTLLNTGHVDHRVLECRMSLSASDLVAAGNLINERFRETDLRGLADRAGNALPSELQRLDWLYKKIVPVLKQALADATSDEVYVEGTSHILKQPEFNETGRAVSILDALEQRRKIFQVLSSALLGNEVTVMIGSESRFEEMSECSFIASRYSVGDRICGTIGVVGPTRMDYRHAVAAVRFMASNLSELLTSLSIG